MDIRVATLCDFAQVREGLLFVSSAGITRVYRESFPAPVGVMLALVLEMSPVEAANPNKIKVRVEDADGQKLAEMVGEVQVKLGSGHDPGELVNAGPLSGGYPPGSRRGEPGCAGISGRCSPEVLIQLKAERERPIRPR